MTLKGNWNQDTLYSVGDVVVYEADSTVYHLQKACPTGTAPVDTLYWSRVSQTISDAVKLVMDGVGMAVTQASALIPNNIDDEGIILKSGDNEYLVSVDATGDTPEVVAELIVPDDDEGGVSA